MSSAALMDGVIVFTIYPVLPQVTNTMTDYATKAHHLPIECWKLYAEVERDGCDDVDDPAIEVAVEIDIPVTT